MEEIAGLEFPVWILEKEDGSPVVVRQGDAVALAIFRTVESYQLFLDTLIPGPGVVYQSQIDKPQLLALLDDGSIAGVAINPLIGRPFDLKGRDWLGDDSESLL